MTRATLERTDKAITATGLRLPKDLHDRLKEAADERDLSVNFLIVKAVEDLLENLIPANELKITRR